MKEKRIPWRITSIVIFWTSIFVIAMLCFSGMMSKNVTVALNVALGAMGATVLSILCLAYSSDNIKSDKSAKLFYVLIVLAYTGILSDNFSRALDGNTSLTGLNWFLCVLSFTTSAFTAPAFLIYQRSIFDIKTNDNWLVKLVNLFMVLDLVYIILGSAFGWIFYIGKDGHFYMNFGYNISMVYPIVVYLLCMVDNVHLKIEVRKHVSLLAFNVTPLVGLFVAYITGFGLLYIASSLTLLLMYITLQKERSIDYVEQAKIIAEQNRDITEQQTQIMMSQIKPHFVYNTLSSIYYLCDKDTNLAKNVISDFSDYLRVNMDSLKNNPIVPFEKELEHTKNYLSIELIRFKDILNVEYDIGCTNFDIPALTLQPLVENAVKYGIRSKKEGGTVKISTKREDNAVKIIVHDDGLGFNPNEVKNDEKTHLGIENTRKRLEIMCNGELFIKSNSHDGTTVTIVLKEKEE